MHISPNLVIRTFYQYCKRPVHKKGAGTYNAECPYCHEGKSAGRKRRFFYIPDQDYAYCHNCNESKSGLDFVKDMTGMTFSEIMVESDNNAQTVEDIIKKASNAKKPNLNSLPVDSINLFDSNQVSFYKENKVVKDALTFINERRLNTAVNKPKALWLSLTDYVHKNRVVIPFYSDNNKIDYYQSRALYPEDINRAKYLSKANSDKGIFNLDKVSADIDYIFLQEGPIDAMFLRNSIALAGIHPTDIQLDTITSKFPFHTIVYVLDNQWLDKTSYKVTKELLDKDQCVFLWPKELNRFKDLNELCIHTKKDEINPEFIIKHTYCGVKGLLNYSLIKTA